MEAQRAPSKALSTRSFTLKRQVWYVLTKQSLGCSKYLPGTLSSQSKLIDGLPEHEEVRSSEKQEWSCLQKRRLEGRYDGSHQGPESVWGWGWGDIFSVDPEGRSRTKRQEILG